MYDRLPDAGGYGRVDGLELDAALDRASGDPQVARCRRDRPDTRQGRRRGAPRLRAILAPWRQEGKPTPKLRSRLEARLLPRLVEEGLPRPGCNVRLQIDGHWLEVDLLWEEQRLAIETDGEETHGTRAAFQRDRWRDQLLVAAGYRTARVTWEQVRDEPSAVINRIARMLKAT